MLARLSALALVALGAVDALPVHEPEPLAPHHHHAAHVDAKHGSVLDGLRELELDLEALTALAHRVKRAPSGPDGRPKLGHGGTLERAEAAPAAVAAASVVDRSEESNAALVVPPSPSLLILGPPSPLTPPLECSMWQRRAHRGCRLAASAHRRSSNITSPF